MHLLRLYFIVFFISFLSYAQDEVEFKLQNQFYIKGDAFYIGNNILSKNETTPYSSFTVINDAINMKYIDVDNDVNTFSSSKASFSLKDSNARIKYAVLYWTGVYPYSKGSRGIKKDTYYYKKDKDREGDFTQIKFKTPKDKKYHDVKGVVLFDGISKEGYKDNAPYVCFADVTHLMSKTSNSSGEYSAANIRATQGYVSGGSTAGWLMFVVYESENKPEQYITSYNGFSTLTENTVEIDFNGFKTKNSGDSNSTIFFATLEGDSKLNKDRCGIVNNTTNTVQYLSSKLRAKDNFFNGKMTIDSKYFSKRTPYSFNTLGFDVLKQKIDSKYLNNNQTNFRVRLESNLDRFYVFFTAFKTEINKEFYRSKTELNNTENEIENSKKIKPSLANVSEVLNDEQEKKFNKILKKDPLNIPGLSPGYYIITNVFSVQKNAIEWQEFLISKGHEAQIFINPKNNWHYVFVYNDVDALSVYKTHQKLAKSDYFKEIWVFKIN